MGAKMHPVLFERLKRPITDFADVAEASSVAEAEVVHMTPSLPLASPAQLVLPLVLEVQVFPKLLHPVELEEALHAHGLLTMARAVLVNCRSGH